jgi:hypothetical protein
MDAFNAFIIKVETEIINPIITLVTLAAFVIFVWGVVQYIANGADDKARTEGQKHMIWGIVGLVIIFAASGILLVLKKIVAQ